MVVNLSWPSHSRDLTEGIWRLFQQSYKTDFEICINGDFISTHHVIMAAFCTTIKESNYNALFLNYDPKILKRDLESVVEFLYRGEIRVAEDRLSPIMDLANHLGFKILSDTIVQSIKTKSVSLQDVTEENVNQSPPRMEILWPNLETREIATQISPNRVKKNRKYKKTTSKIPEYIVLPMKTVKSAQKSTNSIPPPQNDPSTSCLSELTAVSQGDAAISELSEFLNNFKEPTAATAMEINSEINVDVISSGNDVVESEKNSVAKTNNCDLLANSPEDEQDLFFYSCPLCECKTNNRSSFSYHMTHKHKMDIYGNLFTSNLWHPH